MQGRWRKGWAEECEVRCRGTVPGNLEKRLGEAPRWGGPVLQSLGPSRGAHRKSQTSFLFTLPLSPSPSARWSQQRKDCPAYPKGLTRSPGPCLGSVGAGRRLGGNRGFFFEDEQRLRSVLLPLAGSPAPSPRSLLAVLCLLDANRTLSFASKQLKRTSEQRLGGKGNCPSGRGGVFLGSVVLFAVGFIAQDTINLVDKGR